MGGKAFSSKLPGSSFPRLPPAVYNALKARLTPILQYFYHNVVVPHEAPEKLDHGDIDFLVAVPKFQVVTTPQPSESEERAVSETTPGKSVSLRQKRREEALKFTLPHDLVREAIGATQVIPAEGNGTSNFAVPFAPGEWVNLGYGDQEMKRRQEVEGGDIYFQVDVHVCADIDEWERLHFCHSYGDTGMILGTIGHMMGLSIGPNGLKLPMPPSPAFPLSNSFEEILCFMGLSMDRWEEGFRTKKEIYEWIASSRWFDSKRFTNRSSGIMDETSGVSAKKLKQERAMFNDFVEWASQQPRRFKDGGERKMKKEEIRQHALKYFDKEEEMNSLLRVMAGKKLLKESFNGTKVMEWTAWENKPYAIKKVMDGVLDRAGGSQGVIDILETHGEIGLKELVLEVKETVVLKSSVTTSRCDESAFGLGILQYCIIS